MWSFLRASIEGDMTQKQDPYLHFGFGRGALESILHKQWLLPCHLVVILRLSSWVLWSNVRTIIQKWLNFVPKPDMSLSSSSFPPENSINLSTTSSIWFCRKILIKTPRLRSKKDTQIPSAFRRCDIHTIWRLDFWLLRSYPQPRRGRCSRP